jgi:uncharacterized protein YaiL (DUF2058 family)
MASLQDQLLNAGMVDKKKAKQIEKDKRKQAKQAKQLPKGHKQSNEITEQAKKALNEKSARDREINRQREDAAQIKAIAAQIKQLIETNAIDRGNANKANGADKDIAFQFVDGKKIKKMHISQLLQNQLIRGQIAIVKLADSYELVPAAVAEKIKQRDESIIILLNQASASSASDADIEEDDPYAEFVVPDDLMW